MPSDLVGLVKVVGLASGNEVGKGLLVLGSDIVNCNHSRSLLASDQTKTAFAFNNAVSRSHQVQHSTSSRDDVDSRHTHLPAKSGEEDDELNGVNIIGNDNEFSLFGLDKGNNVVETVFGKDGFLGVFGGGLVTLLLPLFSLGKETSLLLLRRFRLVLVQELEELSSSVLVKSVRELGNGRGDLWCVSMSSNDHPI